MAASPWRIHEQEYLEAPGASVLVFHGIYPEGHQGGIEIVHHGERVVTNGDLRLGRHSYSKTGERKVERRRRAVRALRSQPDAALTYSVRVKGEGNAVRISLDLDRALSSEEAAGARFALEFYPPAYVGRTYALGDVSGVVPQQGNGPMVAGGGGRLRPTPLAALVLWLKITLILMQPLHQAMPLRFMDCRY